MRCQCGGSLEVEKTHSAGQGGRVSTARCLSCNQRHRIISFVELSKNGKLRRGEGEKSLAAQIRAKKLVPQLVPRKAV